MTLRLSALFEDKVRDTLRDYKNAAKHIILTKGKRYMPNPPIPLPSLPPSPAPIYN